MSLQQHGFLALFSDKLVTLYSTLVVTLVLYINGNLGINYFIGPYITGYSRPLHTNKLQGTQCTSRLSLIYNIPKNKDGITAFYIA